MTHHSTLLAILAVTLIVICNAQVIICIFLITIIIQVPSECGTEESEYAPCVAKDAADELFQSCCRQFVPNGCLHMCTYETRELPARDLVFIYFYHIYFSIIATRHCQIEQMRFAPSQRSTLLRIAKSGTNHCVNFIQIYQLFSE